MTLINEQIETLFAFTKKKSVPYYDLQVELVDHLASSIEEEMEKEAKLSFDGALQKVYSSFGLFGFAHVVQEREKSLEKSSRKLWWQIAKQHFTLPKIVLTGLVFLIGFITAPHLSGIVQGYILESIVIAFPLFQLITVLAKNHESKRKLLLLQQGYNYSVFSFIIAFLISPVQANPLIENQHLAALSSSLFATWLTILFVLENATLEANRKIRQKAKELYPEAFSAA